MGELINLSCLPGMLDGHVFSINNVYNDMNPSTKRIRKSKGQSKNGCFTCRARKIKCDERKPTCARCQQAKLECEGYPPNVYAASSSTLGQSSSGDGGPSTELVPGQSIFTRPELSEGLESMTAEGVAQRRLAKIGCDLLLNSYGDEHAIGQSILRELILRFINTSQAVKVACAALGAATELQQNLLGEVEQRILVFETHYGKAMALVKKDIDGNQFVPHAIVTACIIFTAIELILRRRQDALTHLGGAYQALKSNSPVIHGMLGDHVTPPSESSSEANYGLNTTVDGDVDTLLRIYDFDTMCFTRFTRPPAMQCVPLEALQRSVHDAHDMRVLDRRIVELLHASVTYINQAARQFLEKVSTDETEHLCAKHVELLQGWISQLTTRIQNASSRTDRDHLLILRNTCMSTMIEMQCVFALQETQWDNHADMFEQIISTTEEILENRDRWKMSTRPLQVLGFTAQISVVQPILLAALRYRDQAWRQRAISCLRRTEREGPCIGEMMAAITQRIAEIEESSATTGLITSDLPLTTSQDVSHQQIERDNDSTIPEAARISLIRVVEDNGSINNSLWPTANSGITVVRMFRRRRPVPILSALMLSSAHFGRPENLTAHLRDRKLNPEIWEETQEQIEFGIERG